MGKGMGGELVAGVFQSASHRLGTDRLCPRRIPSACEGRADRVEQLQACFTMAMAMAAHKQPNPSSGSASILAREGAPREQQEDG